MNGNEIGVSVIIPFYNGIEFIEEAVNSVVRQTHNKWDLTIGINGHSKDSDIVNELTNIINKYQIILKHYETKNAPLTLNALARDAKYEWIAFLDADDYWAPTKIEKQLTYISNYDVIGTHCSYIGNMNGSPLIPFNDISNYNIFRINPMLHSTILIKKELVEFDDHFLYDYNLWFKLFYQKKKFFNVPEILMYHRVHNNSAFNNSNGNYVEELKSKWWKVYNNIN